ncbi:MAG: carboxypeptidase-like regulatory domain-containing protein, partial [Candidatus Nitrosomaritimum yanchengensis]
MFRVTSVLLLSGLVGLFFVSPVWAEEGMLLSVNSLSEFDAGEHPFIYGSATDLGGNPLAGVDIQANFPLRAITATTDSAGEFSMTYPVISELGEYTVTVYATKNNMHLNTQVTYHVIDRQQESNNAEQENISKPKEYDNSKYDLFSRNILEQIEEQKIEDAKREILSEEQQLISKQRLQTQADLENDLKSFEKQHEFYKPRNAFLRFLADIDHSVKNIFWNQFLFTEKKTEDAYIA